jgi:acyl carrier protein
VERWFRRLGEHDTRLINTYAVTETGGQVTCRVYAAGEGAEQEPDSVGRPLPGVEIRLLDGEGREAEEGETGELYVAGPGIAQGYLDDIELTQSRFVHLDAGDDSTRFYRTGDLARRTARGELVFAGRADGQLKWHGYRIETTEIESVVQAHPAVREAAVALRGPADNARLVGYYVTGESASDENATELWPAVGPYQVYDEFLYDLMSTDDVRVDRLRQAYARHARGRVVLDIGTGENALLARLCIDAGARHVYAVEVLAEAAARARETVEALGLKDRITVIEGDIAAVDLPEPVDLVTQGLVGNIGSADGIIPIWNAARRHFGRDMIPVPARCRTRIALAELPDSLEQSPAFTPVARRYAQRVFDKRGGAFDIRLCVRNFPPDGLLTQGAVFEDLDFAGELAPVNRGTARLRAQRRGRVDGLLLWTEVDAGDGAAVDYLENQQAWLPVFLPLPDGGVNVEAGLVADLRWWRDDAAGLCPDYHLELHLESAAHTISSRHQESDAGTTRLHRQLLAAPENTAVGPERLREWVAEHLPAYMVPGAWVRLPALPLNTNGKLDRDRLPDPGRSRPALAAAPVVPRDALEHKLAAIWREALDLEALGVDDNFFDLGGDSLAAVRVISRVQRELNAPVGLAALFDAPTVADLAASLRGHIPSGTSAPMEEGVL